MLEQNTVFAIFVLLVQMQNTFSQMPGMPGLGIPGQPDGMPGQFGTEQFNMEKIGQISYGIPSLSQPTGFGIPYPIPYPNSANPYSYVPNSYPHWPAPAFLSPLPTTLAPEPLQPIISYPNMPVPTFLSPLPNTPVPAFLSPLPSTPDPEPLPPIIPVPYYGISIPPRYPGFGSSRPNASSIG